MRCRFHGPYCIAGYVMFNILYKRFNEVHTHLNSVIFMEKKPNQYSEMTICGGHHAICH